jgi:hypothetical protein
MEEIEGVEPAEEGAELADDPAAQPEEPGNGAPTPEEEAERDQQEEEATRQKPWYRKRFDDLTRQREDERRRADRLEEALRKVVEQRPPEKVEPVEVPATRQKPTREQFNFDDDAYIEAVADWKLEQAEAKRSAQEQKRQAEYRQQQAQQTFEERRASTVDKGRGKHADFEEVVFSLPGDVLDMEMAAAIFEADAPEDVAYYLGKNPKEAARISALPPFKKAIALGKLEAKLTNPERKQTTAPPPPNPIGGREPARHDPDKLLKENPAEWIRLRNEGKI